MSYFSTVLADAPVHWWRCADGGGSVLSDVGSTITQLYVQSTGVMPYSGPSSDGGSCFFPLGAHGGNNKLAVTLGIHSVSVEMWFYLFDSQPSQNNLMELWTSTKLYQLDVLTSGAVEWVGHGNPNNWTATSSAQTFGAWHHVVGVYDGTAGRLYIDGTANGTAISVTDMGQTYAFYLAQNQAGTQSNVALADVAIYSTVLSASRVSAHYAAADQTAQFPLWQGVGGGTNGQGGTSFDLNKIYKAIHKVFPTT